MNQLQVVANELLPVYKTNAGTNVVDGRKLHEFLDVATRYNDWIKNRIEKYDFKENEDFSTLTENLVSGGKQSNHILKLDMAKELCMVENNEQGSKARKYFIEVENRFKAEQIDIARLDPQMQMFHHMFQSVAKTQLQLTETQKQLSAVQDTVETLQETFLQRDEDWRKSINSMLNGAVYRTNGSYRDVRNKSYDMLEERGHCKLDTRLRNLVERLESAGATKTQLRNTTKMDVIEAEPRLKEIYTTIVKELSIGSMKIARSELV